MSIRKAASTPLPYFKHEHSKPRTVDAFIRGLAWANLHAVKELDNDPMPQSLSAVYVHLVFSTKERRRFLREQTVRYELHAQLGSISKELGCAPILTGGADDHIHLLARLGRTITQADWVKELKRVSNLWLKQEHLIPDFAWQGGYADFSVSASNLEQVKNYIANQEQHHQKMGFQDELRELLRRHHVEWDERYVWD